MFRVNWQGIDSFNSLSQNQAIHTLYQCCSSSIWALRVAAGRPFADEDALQDYAARILDELHDSDFEQALEGHPRIGERSDHASSQREQSAVAQASDDVLTELADANRAYEEKFGHVYLVFADGRSADELLAILRQRMSNEPDAERQVMRAELAKINRNRLHRMLEPVGTHTSLVE